MIDKWKCFQQQQQQQQNYHEGPITKLPEIWYKSSFFWFLECKLILGNEGTANWDE